MFRHYWDNLATSFFYVKDSITLFLARVFNVTPSCEAGCSEGECLLGCSRCSRCSRCGVSDDCSQDCIDYHTGSLFLVENKDSKTNARHEYYVARIRLPEGETQFIMMTSHDLLYLIQRAARNREDIPAILLTQEEKLQELTHHGEKIQGAN